LKFEEEEERHERQTLNWWRSQILNCPLAEDCDDRSSEPPGVAGATAIIIAAGKKRR